MNALLFERPVWFAPGPFLRARGGKSWRLTLRRALRAGRYVVLARATDDKGRREGGYGPANRVRFTVKRYESQRAADEDTWRHASVTLKPVNPDFAPIVLTGAGEDQLRVIAELVEVLKRSS